MTTNTPKDTPTELPFDEPEPMSGLLHIWPIAPDPGPVYFGAPAHISLVSSIHESRASLRARIREGSHCHSCEQLVKMYRRPLHNKMARSLVLIYKADPNRDYVHIPTAIDKRCSDEAKLSHWGMIEEEKVRRPDGGRSGFWRVTAAGERFVRGDLRVLSHALIYNSVCYGLEGDLVSIRDCFDSPFDYDELMAGT